MLSAVPLLGREAAAQPVVAVDSVIRCTGCRLHVGPAISIRGGAGGDALPNMAQAIRQASDGRFYVLFDGDYTGVQEHARDGAYSGRSIGGRGSGPGEFRHIAASDIFTSAETLWLSDPFLQRRTVLNWRTGDVVRTVPGLPIGYATSVVLASGESVFGGPVATRQTAGYPLHVYSERNGALTWIRSFGTGEPALRPGAGHLLFRRLAVADERSFWAAHPNEYRVEMWRTDGQLTRTIVADRAWFPRWTERVVRSPSQPPNPIIGHISVDSAGLLWVLLTAPNPKWVEAISGDRDPMGNRMLVPGRPYVDSVLEILDPTTGQLLVHHRFGDEIWGFAARGLVWRTWIDPASAEPQAEVIPLRLVRP